MDMDMTWNPTVEVMEKEMEMEMEMLWANHPGHRPQATGTEEREPGKGINETKCK
jgi:hypothetical protein